jgi:paraquat-inducible protein A
MSAPVSIPRQETIVCRRCRKRYVLPANGRVLLAACPNCGAAPQALWRRVRLRHNGPAAVLAVLAMIVLAVAIVLPFISMNKLGSERVFSLVGGIVELFRSGNTVIGVVLLVFSVIFPFAKLIALLVATSSMMPLSLRARQRLHHLSVVTGRYSLLDILVVAIMIVLVKFQGIAEAQARPGTILFCVAILLSIVAGLLVRFDEGKEPAA